MAGGPYYPESVSPAGGDDTFRYVYTGAGANAHQTEGMGVAASIGSNRTWMLQFRMPPSNLPTGTAKLLLGVLANATSGAAKINVQWASAAAPVDLSSETLNAEGTTTITWASGNNDQLLEEKITLDADTVAEGEIITMHLVFETSGWTLAQVSCWIAKIIFE